MCVFVLWNNRLFLRLKEGKWRLIYSWSGPVRTGGSVPSWGGWTGRRSELRLVRDLIRVVLSVWDPSEVVGWGHTLQASSTMASR